MGLQIEQSQNLHAERMRKQEREGREELKMGGEGRT